MLSLMFDSVQFHKTDFYVRRFYSTSTNCPVLLPERSPWSNVFSFPELAALALLEEEDLNAALDRGDEVKELGNQGLLDCTPHSVLTTSLVERETLDRKW